MKYDMMLFLTLFVTDGVCVFITGEGESKRNPTSLMLRWIYWLRPGPVRDFGTERALAEPLGPIYMIFPN